MGIEDSKAEDMCNRCFWLKEVAIFYETLSRTPVFHLSMCGCKVSITLVRCTSKLIGCTSYVYQIDINCTPTIDFSFVTLVVIVS